MSNNGGGYSLFPGPVDGGFQRGGVSRFGLVCPDLSFLVLFLGRHLVGVWIGGVWNGHFPESEKYFSGAEISRKIPEIPQKERFLPNFRLRNLKFQSPKKCNSIPPLDSLLFSILGFQVSRLLPGISRFVLSLFLSLPDPPIRAENVPYIIFGQKIRGGC